MENNISRNAINGVFAKEPSNKTFSNIKTPRVEKNKFKLVQKTTAKKSSKGLSLSFMKDNFQLRYVSHMGILMTAGLLIVFSSQSNVHNFSVRIVSDTASVSTMDATTTATVAADIAQKSNLIVAPVANKAADQLSNQVSLATSSDLALAKPQIVETAGTVSKGITSYTVAGGDTISTIASKFNITSNTIIWANNLSDNATIKPGQSISILPISGLAYTVQSGDTAASVASTYKSNAAQILAYNNDEATDLVPGQKIIIPDGEKPQPVAPVVSAPAAVTPRFNNIQPLTNYSGGANGYSFGYCTWYVASRRSVPSFWGNANQWYYNAQVSGFAVGSTPEVGAIAWTGAGYFGHVAYVIGASGGQVTISEMNGTAGWDRVDTRTVPASSFLYIY